MVCYSNGDVSVIQMFVIQIPTCCMFLCEYLVRTMKKILFLIIFKRFSLFLPMWTHAQACVRWLKYTIPTIVELPDFISIRNQNHLQTNLFLTIHDPRCTVIFIDMSIFSRSRLPEKIFGSLLPEGAYRNKSPTLLPHRGEILEINRQVPLSR